MPVADALAHEFTRNARLRGEEYAADGRVTLTNVDDDGVAALVRGTVPYGVVIRREDEDESIAFHVDCECPQLTENHILCKHVWATLVVADRKHALGHIAAGVDAFIDSSNLNSRMPAAPPAGGRPPIAKPTPPTPAETFLLQLHQGLEHIATAPAQTFRYHAGELLYVIEPPNPYAPGVRMTTMWRTRKKTGDWGKPKAAGLTAEDVEQADPEDRRILAMLMGARATDPYGYRSPYEHKGGSMFVLSNVVAQHVLPAAAQTGRLAVRIPGLIDEPAILTWDDDEPWRLSIDVTPGEHGLVVGASFVRADQRMALGNTWMVMGSGFLITPSTLSRLTLNGLEENLLIGTLSGRGPIEVPHGETGRLGALLARTGIPAESLPPDLRFTEVRTTPVPRLRLTRHESRLVYARLQAAVEFDYDGTVVPISVQRVHADPASRRLIHRHVEAERAAAARLADVGFRTAYDFAGQQNVLWISPQDLPRVVRVLTAEGWRIEADGQVWRTPGRVQMSVSSGIDWFDLEASVEFGETRVDLSAVLAALKHGQPFVRLDDGSAGMLPDDWLKRYAPIAATGTIEDGRIRFRPSQAALLDALLAAQAESATVSLDEGFRRVRDELTRFDRIMPEPAPASFTGMLRPYQHEALGWFRFLRQFGFGGCLADDMGLGKTVMVLALLASRREDALRAGEDRRTSVIVVPRSLVSNWMSEAARFAPDLRVVDYSGAGRGDHAAAIASADVVLITYGTLRRDVIGLKDVEFDYVILDEAQAIKNAATASAKAVRLLIGRHRLALSGTPIENHMGELWSLFEFLNPGLLGGSTFFQKATARAQPDGDTAALLGRGLRPFFLRRTKQQVARDLPARTEQTLDCELDAGSRALYDGLRRRFRDALLTRVDRVGMGKSGMQILEALLRLRQAACHPGLIDPNDRAAGSAKFDVLLPRLREVIAEGHKALVFSQFTSLLGLLKDVLDAEGIAYEYLDGKTRNRAAHVERFQVDPDVPLFLISLKAGGLGLNLTAAEYVFLLDPWWNPAVEAQAIDRTHRIGQTREVFAYRVIAKDTVEEKVLALQQTKRALADAVLGASATGLRQLTRDDLALLLS